MTFQNQVLIIIDLIKFIKFLVSSIFFVEHFFIHIGADLFLSTCHDHLILNPFMEENLNHVSSHFEEKTAWEIIDSIHPFNITFL